MHMRRKPWARPELSVCPYYYDTPSQIRGSWRAQFKNPDAPLCVEMGCGKGVSTTQMAWNNQNVNYIALDVGRDVLGVFRRNVAAQWGEKEVDNLKLGACNIEYISQVFAPEDGVERIYIHFCNPWSQKKKRDKRRLTHPRQLLQYRDFLKDEGEIYFKTDHDGLFDDSIRYFAQAGFEITYLTRDLHASGFEPNYQSEHEKMYAGMGVPIKFLIARKAEMPAVGFAQEAEDELTPDQAEADDR